MGITANVNLPSEDELTVQEVNLSGPVLKAGAFHLGKSCEKENNEFMLCRKELNDPRACLKEGRAVTRCALKFFSEVKKACSAEFMQYVRCIDKSSPDQQFTPCRKTQAVWDKCALDNMGIERAPFDYFARVQIHHTNRPRPKVEGPAVYPDATPSLPDDAPRQPANYGSRFMFMW